MPKVAHGSQPNLNVGPDTNSPRPSDGDFVDEALLAQQEALATLTMPQVAVISRKSRNDPERFAGSTIYRESVRFSDGSVRLATIVEPDVPVTDVLTVSADPWVTGEKGFNKGEIEQMAELSLPLVWLHHQSRHRIFPPTRSRLLTLTNLATSKGIAQAAGQELALVNDLSTNSDRDHKKLMRRGYSRSGMSGNAFIVQAEEQGAEVVFSHHEAECFPHAIGMVALAKTFVKQSVREGITISGGATELINLRDVGGTVCRVVEYLQTLDIHPMNIANEMLWIKEFMSGEAGDYAQAVRLDAKGIRLHYEADEWAQISKWLPINNSRPGIVTVEMPGAHTAGARRKMRTIKGKIFSNIAEYALGHYRQLDGIRVNDVLPDECKQYIVSTA